MPFIIYRNYFYDKTWVFTLLKKKCRTDVCCNFVSMVNNAFKRDSEEIIEVKMLDTLFFFFFF